MDFLIEEFYGEYNHLKTNFNNLLKTFGKDICGAAFTIYSISDKLFKKMSKMDGSLNDSYEFLEKQGYEDMPIVGYCDGYKGCQFMVGTKTGNKIFSLNLADNKQKKNIMEVANQYSSGQHFSESKDAYVYTATQIYTTETAQSFLKKAIDSFDAFFEVKNLDIYHTLEDEEKLRQSSNIIKCRKIKEITKEQMLEIINSMQERQTAEINQNID